MERPPQTAMSEHWDDLEGNTNYVKEHTVFKDEFIVKESTNVTITGANKLAEKKKPLFGGKEDPNPSIAMIGRLSDCTKLNVFSIRISKFKKGDIGFGVQVKSTQKVFAYNINKGQVSGTG
jgi:hypothetical protein